MYYVNTAQHFRIKSKAKKDHCLNMVPASLQLVNFWILQHVSPSTTWYVCTLLQIPKIALLATY